MGKPFANAPGLSGEIQDTYLLGMQSGTDLDDTGLVQMKKISAQQLREYVEKSLGSVWTFRGSYSSSVPDNAVPGDVFFASATFTSEGVTYDQGSFYAYTVSGTWSPIGDALEGIYDVVDIYVDSTVKPELDAYTEEKKANVQSVYADDMAEVNAKVSRNTKAIANLVQKEGVVSISYPDSIYGRGEAPAGMAKFAEVSCLRGVSRVGNNLVNPADSSTSTVNGITFTNNGDGSWTVSGATGESPAQKQIVPYNMKANHSYLLAGARNNVFLAYIGQGGDRVDEGNGIVATITTDTYKALFIYVRANVTLSSPVTIRPISTDLTVYFGPDPSVDVSTITISDIQQNYPELLVPSAYDTGSLVDTTYGAVDSEGVNLWDEEWEQGYYDQSTGQPVANTSRIRSKNAIPIKNGETYYALIPSATISVLGYDNNGNYIGVVYDGYQNSFTVSLNGVTKVKIYTGSGYGGNYNYNIQICLNSYTDKTVYHPYFKSILTLPSPVTLRSAGSVAEEYYPETGRVTHPIGQVDAGTLDWGYNGSYGFYVPLSTIPNIKAGSYSASSELLCPSYTKSTQEQITAIGGTDMAMAIGIQFLYASNSKYSDAASFKAAMSGVPLYFELATPSADTYVDPIPDNFLLTEAGGTITPKQTQSKQIDTRFDIDYQAL
jgi:hypothetical protein